MPISADDVRWVYNLIFLRDPENEAIVSYWSSTCNSTRDLIEIIQKSEEALQLRNLAFERNGLSDLSEEGLLRVLVQHRSDAYNLSGEVQKSLLPLLRLLAPHASHSFKKVRMGRDNDGGYIMLDNFEGAKAAYSLGINDDVSWDEDIAQRGIPVFQYDHTINELPANHPLFKWSKIGIEGIETDNSSLDTLANLVKSNNHKENCDLILKCDIEGHEWSMLANAPQDLLPLFSQIVVELHFTGNFCDQAYLELIGAAVRNLTLSHRVVHVHANNCSPYLIMGGISLPCALELTLVRAEGLQLELSSEVFPTELDMPNSPTVIDYRLGTFRF